MRVSRAVVVLVLVVSLAVIGLAWWAHSIDGSSRALLTVLRSEKLTMIAWDHQTESGAIIRIEVYRRDYGSDQEWLEAVQTLQETFPPNQGG